MNDRTEGRGPTVPDTEEPLIDFAALVERCLGSADFAKRVLHKFRETFSESLSAMRQALDASDATDLARRAHQLKGAAANVSAVRLAALASRLEQTAQQRDLLESRSLLETIADAEMELNAEIGRRGG